MAPITPRLDVNKSIVDKAKQAKALRDDISEKKTPSPRSDEDLKKIHFSDTLTVAMKHLKDVLDLLNRAGFREREPLEASEKRPRRVDAADWKKLKKAAKGRGVSRMDLVRALLTLLGDEYDHYIEGVSVQSDPAVPPTDQPELPAESPERPANPVPEGD